MIPRDLASLVKIGSYKPMRLVGQSDPVLKIVANEITEEQLADTETLGALRHLADRMEATRRVKQGYAVAAPQVGFSYRLVVAAGKVILNPTYVVAEDSLDLILAEGCLSLPGRWYTVNRPSEIIMTGFDLNIETHIEEPCSAVEAQMWIHEIEHLDGLLLSDGLYEEIRKS